MRRIVFCSIISFLTIPTLLYALASGFVKEQKEPENVQAQIMPAFAEIPLNFQPTGEPGKPMYWNSDDASSRGLTIEPSLQNHLDQFIRNRGNPIAAVLVADVKTGEILAMSQGRAPEVWDGTHHTALHTGFPAASLFKTVIAAATLELTTLDPTEPLSIWGGCANVNPNGVWLRDDPSPNRYNQLSINRAYGHSCNGFFAKLAVNYVGLNAVNLFAQRFGWNSDVTFADFQLPALPAAIPNPQTSGVHAVGRYAAGFGQVGISTVHAAWQNLAIANNGVAIPLRLFVDQPKHSPYQALAAHQQVQRLVTEETALKLRQMMKATILGGTATSAFNRGKHRQIRNIVGGKTGTLTGRSPFGLTTWFTGLMPVDDPEVVVAAVVVLEDLWHIKAPDLAAEALWAYRDLQNRGQMVIARGASNEKDSH